MSLAGIPGQITLGYVSDRIGREWVWTVGSLGFALCYLSLLLLRQAPTPALLYFMVASQGALGYGLTSVIGAIPAEIFQGRHYGAIFGTLMLASIGGGAVGPWVTGVLYDATGSYTLAFWIAIGCCALGGGHLVCAPTRCGPSPVASSPPRREPSMTWGASNGPPCPPRSSRPGIAGPLLDTPTWSRRGGCLVAPAGWAGA